PDFEEMVDLPQYQERGSFEKVHHPVIGEVIQPGAPFHMSETPWKINRPAPLLGEHNTDVYQKILGLPEEDVSKLYTEGVIQQHWRKSRNQRYGIFSIGRDSYFRFDDAVVRPNLFLVFWRAGSRSN